MIRRHEKFVLALLLMWSLSGPVFAAEAQKPKVRQVTFSGNTSYDASRLEGLMLTRPSRFLATSRFHREIFQDDLETLLAFYKQNGFLEARIVDTLMALDSLRNEIDITIDIEEGPRTFVEGVTVFGNRFFADSVLRAHIGIASGDPLRRPVIEDAVVSLLSLCAEHGFLEASVTPSVQVNDSAHMALVDFSLHEGGRSRIGSIVISGADGCRPHVIRRELSFAEGDTVKYSELIGSQRRLYLTGLFESVFVRPAPPAGEDSTEREIRVEVKEKPSGELSFSVGYGTVEKVRGRTELSISNLAGTARKAGIGVEGSFIKQGASISFSEPWTLGTRWKTDLSVFGQFKQEPAYHSETIGGKATIGRKLGWHTSLAVSYRLENTNLSRIDLTVPVEEPDPRIRSLGLALSYDSRDNLFDPSVGWYVSWSNELAGGFLQGSNTFAKSVMTVKGFRSLGRQTVVGSALELGWMDSFESSDDVPVSERFYTGGPTSLRGFGYQEVGPLDANDEPFGGQVKLVWNVIEVRRSLYKMFGGVIFVELGGVWTDLKSARVAELRTDFGTGLRVNSPLGILRLDLGINPDQRGDEPATRLSFSMGQAF